MSAGASHTPATGADASGRGDTPAGAPTDVARQPQPARGAEACPLCGAALAPEQDWCLRCGGAARTRLAASPRWTAPVVGVVTVALLALGVLAASLVSIAGGSTTRTGPATTTVTIPAVTVTPTPAAPTGASGTGATAGTGATGTSSPAGATSATGATSRAGVSGITAKRGPTGATTHTKSAVRPGPNALREIEAARKKGAG